MYDPPVCGPWMADHSAVVSRVQSRRQHTHDRASRGCEDDRAVTEPVAVVAEEALGVEEGPISRPLNQLFPSFRVGRCEQSCTDRITVVCMWSDHHRDEALRIGRAPCDAGPQVGMRCRSSTAVEHTTSLRCNY